MEIYIARSWNLKCQNVCEPCVTTKTFNVSLKRLTMSNVYTSNNRYIRLMMSLSKLTDAKKSHIILLSFLNLQWSNSEFIQVSLIKECISTCEIVNIYPYDIYT